MHAPAPLACSSTTQEMARQPFKDFLQEQQQLQWRFYLNNRRRFGTAAGGTWGATGLHEPPGAQPAAAAGAAAEGAGAASK